MILDEGVYATENFSDIGTLTPKLYLKSDVVQGLKDYTFKFMSSENIRPLRLSYVIKYVVYAYYKEYFEV
ncbi:MAG: hypothetical protein R3Y09_04260 [Clostridia bacterium]